MAVLSDAQPSLHLFYRFSFLVFLWLTPKSHESSFMIFFFLPALAHPSSETHQPSWGLVHPFYETQLLTLLLFVNLPRPNSSSSLLKISSASTITSLYFFGTAFQSSAIFLHPFVVETQRFILAYLIVICLFGRLHNIWKTPPLVCVVFLNRHCNFLS